MRLRIPRLNKYSLLFAVVVIFIFLEILFISPKILEKPSDDVVPIDTQQAVLPTKKKDAIEQKALGVHLVENNENKKGYELFASEASGSSEAQWVLKKVKAQFFSDNNANFAVMGDVGEIDGMTKDMNIRGNVITSSTNGYQFKTDSLKYVSKEKIMKSDDSVYMQGPPDKKGAGFKLTGTGLLVDLKTNKMKILSHVEADKMIDLKKFNLSCDSAEFSNTTEEALFSGQVKMILGTSHLSAPQARFFYSKVQKSLEKIVLTNGVRLADVDKVATCKELEIDLLEDKMVLRGQPKVQQGEDEIHGDEIVFLENGKKVKINRVNVQGTRKDEKAK